MYDKNCELCKGSGWYGDNGPGIRGNREYVPCENCNPNRNSENTSEEGKPSKSLIEWAREAREVFASIKAIEDMGIEQLKKRVKDIASSSAELLATYLASSSEIPNDGWHNAATEIPTKNNRYLIHRKPDDRVDVAYFSDGVWCHLPGNQDSVIAWKELPAKSQFARAAELGE